MSLMKREPSASWMKRSLSNASPLCDQVTSGAGVPEASQMRVVGWFADVNTSGDPTFSTGAVWGHMVHARSQRVPVTPHYTPTGGSGAFKVGTLT